MTFLWQPSFGGSTIVIKLDWGWLSDWIEDSQYEPHELWINEVLDKCIDDWFNWADFILISFLSTPIT